MLDEPVMKWMLHLWSYMPCLGSAGVATPHSGRLGKCADQTTGTLVNHHTAGSKEAALAPPSSPPQCGRDATVGVVFLANVNPHCGKPKLAQAQLVLGALTEGWRRTARSKRSLGHWHARDAAHEFWRSLREQDSLVGLRLPSQWIEERYPIFCKAQSLSKAPPFKDFARELKRVMPKHRPETLVDGRRRAITTYTVMPFKEATSLVQAEREAA